MKITIEIDEGDLREQVDQYNESSGVRRGQVGFVSLRDAKRVLKSGAAHDALVERAIELATDSCADMLQLEASRVTP